MKLISYPQFISDMENYLDHAVNDQETYIMPWGEGKNVVMNNNEKSHRADGSVTFSFQKEVSLALKWCFINSDEVSLLFFTYRTVCRCCFPFIDITAV